MAPIRTFIAVELSDNLKAEIAYLQQLLKKDLGNLKWVPTTNFHLTLKFLGDIEAQRVPAITEGLARAVKETAPFSIRFTRLGGFPGLQQPRVLWLGVEEGKSELIELQKSVERELAQVGFAAEKKESFSPHLTLARAREETNLSAIGTKLAQIHTEPTRSDLITSIKLMKSDLRPGGPIYTCLQEIEF